MQSHKIAALESSLEPVVVPVGRLDTQEDADVDDQELNDDGWPVLVRELCKQASEERIVPPVRVAF